MIKSPINFGIGVANIIFFTILDGFWKWYNLFAGVLNIWIGLTIWG